MPAPLPWLKMSDSFIMGFIVTLFLMKFVIRHAASVLFKMLIARSPRASKGIG